MNLFNLSPCSKRFQRILYASHNFHSSIPVANEVGLREQLLAGVKQAMKNKDQVSSTTLRSVLADVYNLDKASGSTVPSSSVVGVLRKAVHRRTESATQYIRGARPDLAEKEIREADILSVFLPPLLSEADIDRVLNEVVPQDGLRNNKKALGPLFRAFYERVDRANVDPEVVKRRAEALLNG